MFHLTKFTLHNDEFKIKVADKENKKGKAVEKDVLSCSSESKSNITKTNKVLMFYLIVFWMMKNVNILWVSFAPKSRPEGGSLVAKIHI